MQYPVLWFQCENCVINELLGYESCPAAKSFIQTKPIDILFNLFYIDINLTTTEKKVT